MRVFYVLRDYVYLYVSYVLCSIQMCLIMNSLFSLHDVWRNQRNIYKDVKNFKKRDCHSSNFCKTTEWLLDLITLQQHECVDKIVSGLLIRTKEHRLIIEARVMKEKCIISKLTLKKTPKQDE